MIATLRNRNFALLWVGGLISRAGDWVLTIGLPIYVYILTRSVLATSLTLLATAVPNILLGAVAGVFVDRWDRRTTLIVTNLLLALGLLPLVLVRTADAVWIVYVVAFVESSIEQFFSPAQNAFVPALVGEAHLVSANSLISLSGNIARLVGPALGGAIAGFFGLNGMVLADTLSFLIAGALVALIGGVTTQARPANTPAGAPAEAGATATAARPAAAGVWHDWLDGLRVIARERTLVVLLAALAITSLGEGVFGVLYPIFVYRILHGGAPQIGDLMSAQAVGGLLGGVLVGWAGQRVVSRWVIGLCAVLFGLFDLAIFNTPALLPPLWHQLFGAPLGIPFFWVQVGLFVAVGMPGIGMLTGAQSLLQATAPQAYLGRVFGVLGVLLGTLGLIGTVTAGTVTDHLGLIAVLNIQGAGYVVAGVLLMALLPRRRQPAPDTVAPDRGAPEVAATVEVAEA